MTVDVSTEVIIACPVAEVSAFAADPDNVPAWYVNISSVKWKTPRPAAVGSQIAFVASFLWRRLAYTYEIVEFEPTRRLVMRTSEGVLPMETTYEWEPKDRGDTRMTLRNRGVPTGFSRWLSPLIGAAVRRANRKDLARLRQILEAQA